MVAVCASLSGCGDDVTAPIVEAYLETRGGDEQQAVKNAALSDDLEVRVVDADGAPIPNIAVSWHVESGGGTITSSETQTDQEGVARTTWQLGPLEGEQTAHASVPNDTVEFVSWATPEIPEDWATVISLNVDVEVEGNEVVASMTLRNDWAGRVIIHTPLGCLSKTGLFDSSGQEIKWYGGRACTFASRRHRLDANSERSHEWTIDTSDLEPGIYTIRFWLWEGHQVEPSGQSLPPAEKEITISG